ncbi:hypothetical protein FRC11_003743 [Ceratobasidium sp. 423]|nr:hypothetical protein FRC11_003743 [Ceratobasidium sp. 423]
MAAPIPPVLQGNTPVEPVEAQQLNNTQVPQGAQAHPLQNILAENHLTVEHVENVENVEDVENAENADDAELVPIQGTSSLYGSLYGWVTRN